MRMNRIVSQQVRDNELWLRTNGGTVALAFVAPDIVRLRFAAGAQIPTEETFVVEHPPAPQPFTLTKRGRGLVLRTKALRVNIATRPLAIEVRDARGRLRVALPAGLFAEVRGRTSILRVGLQPDERITGLGQDPMARLNHRGHERRMWQEWCNARRSGNAGMPFCLSSAGYALLLNSSWPSRFAIGEARVADTPPDVARYLAPAPWPWATPSGESDPHRLAVLLDDGVMDVFLICRDDVDALHRGYYTLTGRPPLLPRWAYGYIQCKNRYRSQEELLAIGREYRRRGIPGDALVIDWLWFKEFGDLQWEPTAWPDPRQACAELAALGFHVLQAQHPYIERASLNYDRFRQAGWLTVLPDESTRPTFDHSNPAARAAWWREIRRFYDAGIRGWWTDMGELEMHPVGATHHLGPRERVHNIYSTLWTKGLYDHQRRESSERVFSLPRTAYPGIHRYGTALWSGDIDANWEVFRDQVVIGQGVCLSGQPLWTTDVGGFITGADFTAELYVRWLQWGVFCPIFRTHGTRPGNEPWSFGPDTEAIVTEFIRLRYRLLPYIYSLARRVHETGQPMLRAMSVDFPDDPVAVAQEHQFLFGPALLVAPITDPGARRRRVYLPAGTWYDFWTDAKWTGPCWVDAEAPLARIPLFVRAGAIIPMLAETPLTATEPWTAIDVHAWPGAAGRFDLYDDDGATYGYEQGAFAVTPLTLDRTGKVRVGAATGDLGCVPANRRYRKVVHGRQRGTQSPPVTVHVDRVEHADGLCVLRAVVLNRSGKTATVKLKATVPVGWSLVNAPLVVWWKPQLESTHAVADRGEFRWELRPTATALPVTGHGEIAFAITTGKRTESIVRPFATGNGWACRWAIAQQFPNDTADAGFAAAHAPEQDATAPQFSVAGQIVPYRRIEREEFNCFGYVNLLSTTLPPHTGGVGLAYARGRVWSPDNRETRVELGAEGAVKLWVNQELLLTSDRLVLSRVHEPVVRLRRGWNDVLLKVALNFRFPWSGRDFGFNFRFVNTTGQPAEDLLYEP